MSYDVEDGYLVEGDPPAWFTPATAKSALNISVTQAGLDVAREECLRIRGLALGTEFPPTESFATGVVYQALANKQASQADVVDEMGSPTNTVRLYPFDKKIMAMLIIASPDADNPGRDTGYVRSLVG